MEKARKIVLKIFNILQKPEMRILPGHLAFFLVMTIIPLVALITTIAAALSISTEAIRQAIITYAPDKVATILNSVISGGGINFNIMVFYLSAFLLASNGTYSMINSSNEIYKVSSKSIIERRAKAIMMTFILVSLFLFLLIVPLFGGTIFEILSEVIGNQKFLLAIQKVLVIIKYPIILLFLYINIKLMYVIAPDEEIPSKSASTGAMFTTVGWVLATEIFAFYIERFSRYDVFYGSISNMLVLILWVYLLSYIYVFGMVINASNYRRDLE